MDKTIAAQAHEDRMNGVGEPTEITPYEGVSGVTGEYDPSDFAIPYVSIVQASSDAVKNRVASAGAFLGTDGEQADAILFVPLHIRFVRDFYDKQAQQNICSSNDRVIGYPRDLTFFRTHGNLDIPEGDSLACNQCPFQERPISAKLACNKGYVVTCYDLEKEQPFMFRVRGTAVRPFRDRFIGAVAMGRTKPWARSFEMTAKLIQGGGNSWFAPELKPTEGFDKEKQAEWEAYAGGIVAPSAPTEAVTYDDLPFE